MYLKAPTSRNGTSSACSIFRAMTSTAVVANDEPMMRVYVIGVACVYDVFDQQFATFFKTFFATPQEGTRAFGFATTAGEICNAIIMFCSPWKGFEEGGELLIKNVIDTGYANHVQNKHPHSALTEQVKDRFRGDLRLVGTCQPAADHRENGL